MAERGRIKGGYDDYWMERMGCAGISRSTLLGRLNEAANECDYFAPSLSGINRLEYREQANFQKPQPLRRQLLRQCVD